MSAWQHALAGAPGVTIRHDDILTVAHGALVSPADCSGHMDVGIDAHYLAFFGHELQRRVCDAILSRPQGHLPVGAATIVATGHPTITHLIVAPTMDLPGEVDASHSCHCARSDSRPYRDRRLCMARRSTTL